MSKLKPPRDPRGHSLRIYGDLYDSPAFKALSPHDVMAYLAVLRELKGYNNGDLSLPLSRAKTCGISHHLTLARSLRALCAVGLIAITRKGGCAKGGQRLPNLYRVTDRECFDIPAKCLQALKVTNEWQAVTSIEHGHHLIAAAEVAAKAAHEKKTLGHGVTVTRTPRDVVSPKTRTPRDTWPKRLGHGVTMAENPANPSPARVSGGFSRPPKNDGHRTPRVSPLYLATPGGEMRHTPDHDDDSEWPIDGDSACPEVVTTLAELWARVGCRTWLGVKPAVVPVRLEVARHAQQLAIAKTYARARPAPAIRHTDNSVTRERDEYAHDLSAWVE